MAQELHTGLEDKNRKALVELLNKLLGDEFVLLIKTKNYHWNLEGMNFSQLHEFFDEQAVQVMEIIDEVAERARKVGGYAAGSMKEFLKETRLKETPGVALGEKKMLQNLLDDHEAIIRELRTGLAEADQKLGDMGTSDDLTGWMKAHEKMAWMLRSHIG